MDGNGSSTKDDDPASRNETCKTCENLKARHRKIDPVQLVQSAKSKMCLGCMLLLDVFNKFNVDLSDPRYSESFHSKYPSGPALTVSNEQFIRVGAEPDLELEIFAATKNPPPPLDHLREAGEIPGNTGSTQTMARIANWLEECTNKHRDIVGCPPNINVPLPSRLIQVSPSNSGHTDMVRLVETAGETGTYACVSHCWGPKPLIQTRKSNYDQHKTGIPFSELPKTFQDAIKTTCALGIPFLWIDSLCIIQDDNDDWQKEAALMANIYQGGRLTLSASNSASSEGGCFMDGSKYLSKEITTADANGQQHFARARVIIDHGAKWPILRRGWVYQERLLSPRVVHFGHAEVVWECFENISCECSRVNARDFGFGSAYFSLGKKKLLDRWTVSPEHWAMLPSWRDRSVHAWRDMVTVYSWLNLTYPKDIFPALSGTAKQFQRSLGGVKYIAGMWEHTLVDDLLWASSHFWEPRPPEWNSPTWSWACLAGGQFGQVLTGVNYEDIQFFSKLLDTHVRVDEVSVDLQGLDPTGQIKGGHLILTASILTAEMKREFGDNSIGHLEMVGYDYTFDELEQLSNNFRPDYCLSAKGPGFVPIGTVVSCLKMVTRADKDDERFPAKYVFYLVLREIHVGRGPEPVFERIGIVHYKATDAAKYEHLERKMTVKIL